jgi:hypothetical protein
MTAMIYPRRYKPLLSFYHPRNEMNTEPVPKLIDCALPRTVLGQALAVLQAFSLAAALQNCEFQGCFPKN